MYKEQYCEIKVIKKSVRKYTVYMLKWGWDTKKTELVNLSRFGCLIKTEYPLSNLKMEKRLKSAASIIQLTYI